MRKPVRSKTGIWTLVVSHDHQRRNLTLGKVDASAATHFAANIDALISHRRLHPHGIPPILESWVRSISPRHREQLGEIRVLDSFDASLTVDQLIEAFLKEYESRPDDEIRQTTKRQFRSAMTHRIPPVLKEAFVSDIAPRREHSMIHAKPVFSSETKALFRTVESWQREHFSKSTWSRANGRLREIGVWAVDHGIVEYNPFTLLKKPGETNPDRNVYVEREWVLDAMDQSIDPDTRLCFALGRFAGLRLPSEARSMKWSHIDWKRKQMKVLDSKKREFRTMPLFDLIETELLRVQEGATGRWVLSDRFRSNTDANNYSLMKEAVARTEFEPWEKLRQNLRASCENDLLAAGFDERQVIQWLGHTVSTSRKHYQKTTDAEFLSAVETESNR